MRRGVVFGIVGTVRKAGPVRIVLWAVVFATVTLAVVAAQRTDAFVASRDHAAIRYSTGPVSNRVTELNKNIQDGTIRLTLDGPGGYLRSTLNALDVPVESQVAVFSQTSKEAKIIGPRNPRTIFFNDDVAVGWVRGGTIIEVAAHDRQQGVNFYTLSQAAADKPRFVRDDQCLECHQSWETLGVPGMFVLSTFPRPDENAYAGGFASDHRSPVENRWGGWYVTGRTGPIRHMGNMAMVETETRVFPVANPREPLASLEGRIDLTGYLSPYSDVVALMVLEHQTHAINLLTRLGWEARLAAFEQRTGAVARAGQDVLSARVRGAVDDLVDYLLFVDEAVLPGKIDGSSGFAQKFGARGPRDQSGRSLRQLDLTRRLMRFPCSYVIYDEAFDTLVEAAKQAVYQRMWHILSGQAKEQRYARLSAGDRRAIVEILRDTKKGLPEYFR
jgi:hypothetical protein